MIKSLESVA